MAFLPGLDGETAHHTARRIGRATALPHTSVDAPGFNYDNERESETGRDLLDAAELRQMVAYEQAVAIVGAAPPVWKCSPGPTARQLAWSYLAEPSLREAGLTPGQIGSRFEEERQKWNAERDVTADLLEHVIQSLPSAQ